jgi:ECF sigma factor
MEIDETQPNETSLLLLERYRDGEDLAAEAIFSRYFDRIASLARSRISRRLASRTDPEDVVMSVYRSLFAGAGGPLYVESRRRSLATARVHHQTRNSPTGTPPWS